MNNNEDIMNKVLDVLKPKFTLISYNTLFVNINLYELTDDKITLVVPFIFQKITLLKSHYETISDAFEEVTGIERPIEILLKTEVESLTNSNDDIIVDKVEDINNNTDEEFESNLNKNLNFDNFVVGDTNKFARTAALAVAENPGSTYNPLFIYGKSGLGKTHLMHAIGNYINDKNPNLKVLYTTSDDFRKDYAGIANSNENTMEVANKFKNKYRNIDVLIIDDIQYLVDAKKTQEEFFHTFNDLHGKNKQIIISSDRSPDDLKQLESRLSSRLAWGLPVDIYPPDFELRVDIIKDKLKRSKFSIEVSDEAVDYIANNFDLDVRSIEGALNRLSAYTALSGSGVDIIDLDFVSDALRDYVKKNPYVTNDIISIQKAVADYYNITVEVLKGKKRSANIAYPRMVAMYLCRALTDQSFPRIGLEFGGRDHSTVIHACDKIEEDLKSNGQLKEIINEIKSKL
ncbi:MAG: chromosomal replication initiator protein DnaA [Candidatus Coprovivens sp.]